MVFPRWLLVTVIVIGALFCFFGFFFLAAIPLPILRNYLAARHWAEAPATVVSSELAVRAELAEELYAPRIVYRYRYDGRNRTGDRYNVSDVFTPDYERHHAIVKAHPAGKTVTCYVNPDMPDIAVIDRAMPPEFTVALASCLGVTAFGAVLASVSLYALRRQRRMEPTTPES